MISKLKNIGIVNVLLTLIAISFLTPPQILNPIFLGMLIVFVLIRHLVQKRTFYKDNFNKISIGFIVYFLILLCSLLYSEDLKEGLNFISQSMALLAIPLLPILISKKEVDLKFISRAYTYFLCFIFFLLFFKAISKNLNDGYTFEYIKVLWGRTSQKVNINI